MKKLNLTRVTFAFVIASIAAVLMTVFAAADGPDFNTVVQPIIDLLNAILWPLIAIVGAAGAVYCVFLGVKFAKAEEPQDREKAKTHLKNAIIGFGLIFVLMLTLKLLMPVMENWVKDSGKDAAETVAMILR